MRWMRSLEGMRLGTLAVAVLAVAAAGFGIGDGAAALLTRGGSPASPAPVITSPAQQKDPVRAPESAPEPLSPSPLPPGNPRIPGVPDEPVSPAYHPRHRATQPPPSSFSPVPSPSWSPSASPSVVPSWSPSSGSPSPEASASLSSGSW